LKGVTKYGTQNAKGVQAPLELSSEERGQFAALSSMSLTKKTWSSYTTAERMLAKCCKEKGIRLEWPVTESMITKFVLWLAFSRNLSSGSISTYLAGIRQAHLNKGMPCPEIRSDKINQLLKGKANMESENRRESKVGRRQPVTPDILRLVKSRISDSELHICNKRMVWAVGSILFFGALRGAEILCRSVSEFDPAYTLCTQDISVVRDEGKAEKLQIKVKAPKEMKKGGETIVDIFQTSADICPVRAFVKWREQGAAWEWGQPAFRWRSGKPLTSSHFNKLLRERLEGYVTGADKWFTTHSF
jgi:Phage integrase SAM-like domain